MQEAILNIYNFKRDKHRDTEHRSKITISAKSKYGDLEWDISNFDPNPNVKPSSLKLSFDFKLDNGDLLSNSDYASLRETMKELIYSMASSPRGKAPKPATLKKRYTCLRSLINWMIANQFSTFGQLSIEDTDRYLLSVKSVGNHPMTKVGRVKVLSYLWTYRKHLNEPLKFDPLKGKSAEEILGVKKDHYKLHRYDFIPDIICQDLIRSSINLIRERGAEVATALLMREKANMDEIRRGKSKANRDRAKANALTKTNYTNAQITCLARQLVACCYTVICFFSGIRASEMLSLGPDRIIQEDGITWMLGNQYKIEAKPRKWMVPEIVFEAFNLAKLLTNPMRDSINLELEHVSDPTLVTHLEELRSQLFLNWGSRREHGYLFTHGPQVSNVKSSIQTSLKEIIKLFDIKDDDGSLWNLHPHQFRKSFVRFMCANAMNIHYLREHLGHKSLDMTVYYDSDDIELTQELTNQLNEFKVQKLNPIFNQELNITGAGAANLVKERRDYYAGIISYKSKNAFVQDLADDISLRETGHSWCMGDSNNGNCTGVVGCMMDITMTQKCESALITEEHLPAWQKIKARNELLLSSSEIGFHHKEAIRSVIKETIDPTIHALSMGRIEGHGE